LKLLEQQVSQAKDRVEHAKAVADNHREKLAQETEEKRQKLEARQRRVESRRQKLLRAPRSALLELGDWSVCPSFSNPSRSRSCMTFSPH
jgi:hypothetical protein